jgi:tRNA modification GTPase
VPLRSVQPRTAQFGRLVSGEEIVDQIVATVFRAPASATGEDVVEITCHGGSVTPRRVLSMLFEAGGVPAEPGEFTRRAFLNGKIDLAQAESIAGLIHASSEEAQRTAVRQLEGRYSALLERLREEILETTALIELELDFSEEDVAFADTDRLTGMVSGAQATISRLLASARTGAAIRDGVRVVIAGRPNAGKSTLLNALVGSERAIVSERPGTTTDTIDVDVERDGVLFRFVDTAGLREAPEAIEAEGVSRAEAAIGTADVVLVLSDGSLGGPGSAPELDGGDQNFGKRLIRVANKGDLMSDLQRREAREKGQIVLSARLAREDEGELDELLLRIREVALGSFQRSETAPIVIHERHVAHLRKAGLALESASKSLALGIGRDLLSADLRAAAHELGCITGAVTNEEVLGAIFSRFCIGK